MGAPFFFRDDAFERWLCCLTLLLAFMSSASVNELCGIWLAGQLKGIVGDGRELHTDQEIETVQLRGAGSVIIIIIMVSATGSVKTS